METVLYADVLFFVNFSMDFIALSAAASLGAVPKKAPRFCFAAAIGAIYGVFATVSSLSDTIQLILTVLVGLAMCTLSFGLMGSIFAFLKQAIIFWGCSALLAGIMTAILSNRTAFPKKELPYIVLAAVIVLYFIIRAMKQRRAVKSAVITVVHAGKTATFSALCDSGNLLRDPISSQPVILTSYEALTTLFDSHTIDAFINCDGEALFSRSIKIRLVPRATADTSNIVCSFVPDKLFISTGATKMEKQCLIGVTNCKRNYFGGFDATMPAILLP